MGVDHPQGCSEIHSGQFGRQSTSLHYRPFGSVDPKKDIFGKVTARLRLVAFTTLTRSVGIYTGYLSPQNAQVTFWGVSPFSTQLYFEYERIVIMLVSWNTCGHKETQPSCQPRERDQERLRRSNIDCFNIICSKSTLPTRSFIFAMSFL